MRTILDLVRRRWRAPGFTEVEAAERAFYRAHVSEGMTVFDVGANVGSLSVLFAQLVGNGAVHAFEPEPTACDRLRSALADSGASNVTVNPLALCDRSDAVVLHCYDGPYHAFSSMADRPLAAYGIDAGPPRLQTVPAGTLDGYCAANSISHVDLLKIDVEGAELQVLRGAQAMFQERRIACAVFEFGQTTFDMGNSPAQIAAFFAECGYRLTNLVPGAALFPGGRSARTARFAMHVARPR